MSSDDEDTRVLCKYGASCYQKNSAHLAKFKHPEKRMRSKSPDIHETLKKQKTDNEFTDSTKDDDSCEEQNENNVATTLDDNSVNDINLLDTFENRKKFIKQKFLVAMPNDFYLFWNLCKELNKENPKEAFKSANLLLVGPYDILDETFQAANISNNDLLFLHWRYYYDPPEFQTIITGDLKTGYHIGYFRDSPEEQPCFVGCNEANKNCTISQLGENIFGAINTYLEKLIRTVDPFKKLPLIKLKKVVVNKAIELKLNLNSHGKSRKTVCKSFHNAGIVVPYNRTTQLGYRPLPVDEKELKKMLNQVVQVYDINKDKAFSTIQSVITAATIANDECDFGTALELGINMFCFGHPCFNISILNLLKITYALLNRHTFAQIIEAHLKCRQKEGPHIINFNK